MSEPKILLYYAFAPIADPEAVRLWQRELCTSLGLRGRIIVSPHGINGTVGGELDACKQYLRRTREYGPFAGLEVKWSTGTGFVSEAERAGSGAGAASAGSDAGSSNTEAISAGAPGASGASGASQRPLHSGRGLAGKRRPAPWKQIVDFPKLSVKVRDELVAFGTASELRVDATGVVGGGVHLSPAAVNELVAARGDEVVFFDGRNAYEAAIGRFKGAVVPEVATTHGFIGEIERGAFDELKHRPVVTYCTGGIRCEVLSAAMLERGFTEVYQIDGGIVRYGEAFGNDGLWEGSLAVFDGRESMDFAPGAAVVGRCAVCDAPSNRLVNCADPACRARFVACETHAGERCHEHGGSADASPAAVARAVSG
ncbi:tRNA uridine(34) hydroxylase [Leucobacter sp. W1153]|uniref:tRNA uridine(34) hydroxylase n=1 Tax=Leucobacter sp. W1153 TaxID=3439064 RepID=UPI003F3C41B2